MKGELLRRVGPHSPITREMPVSPTGNPVDRRDQMRGRARWHRDTGACSPRAGLSGSHESELRQKCVRSGQ